MYGNSPASSRQRAQRTLAKAKARPSRVSLTLILLVLLATTGLLGWFGIADFVGALTFAGRITGAVLIAVAFTTLLGAFAAADHWLSHRFDYSGLVALIGAFAAALSNLLILAEILKDGDSALFKALFSALTAGSAWAVLAVCRTSVVIPAPKRVAATLVVTTVIAVANFGYQNLYQPSQREVRPVIRLTVGKPMTNPDRKAFSLPVDITIENRSEAAFYVLGTEFHAMAERVPLSSHDRLRQQWRSDSEQWANFQEVNPVSRREMHQPGELVSAQPWMPWGRWVYASDTFSSRVVVQLPVDTQYDQLAFYASAHLTRKDRARLENLHIDGYSWRGAQVPQWLNKKDFDSIVYKSRIHENNVIDERTREPRYMTVYWRFGAHGVNILETISTENGEDESQESVEGRYGVRLVETGPVERPLWDIKNQH
ncbi:MULTISPECIES: hypothetical protein [unclassified Streptomyces]|uniref:hypothetical protein n=1 Tax=unclassified Streptomyces TaxID=2593676 RepID=UPI001E4972FE|nr:MULTISPECIES: hypothetical protein [unclassified Streptomyces]